METLGYYSPSYHAASLGSLEFVLGQSIAAVLWRGEYYVIAHSSKLTMDRLGAIRALDNAPVPGSNYAYEAQYLIAVCSSLQALILVTHSIPPTDQ